MNDHQILVVEIPESTPHPDADALSLVDINGTTIVINDQWDTGDKAVLIPADFFVPDTDSFQFLKRQSSTLKPKHRRIRPMKLRGVWSEGLLMPAQELGLPADIPVGTDVMETLGIERYDFENVKHNPKIGEVQDVLTSAPPGITTTKYKLHNYKQYKAKLIIGEPVRITEKIHGTNACFGNIGGEIYVGTRNMWVDWRESPSPQAKYYRGNPNDVAQDERPYHSELLLWLANNPGKLIYGEVFGWVASLRYGAKQGKLKFRAFDVWSQATKSWELPPDELSVPVIFDGDFHPDVADRFVDGDSLIEGAKHLREGVVIQPIPDRRDSHIGRVKLKYVSNEYLAKVK